MDGEIKSFILLWIAAILSLTYCHTIGKILTHGINRFFAILPIIFLFLYLPLNLSTLCVGGLSAFFFAWLATFKLLLFAFGKGPLSCSPPLSLPYFISLSTLPIKIQPKPIQEKENKSNPILIYAVKALLVATYTLVYDLKEKIPTKALIMCYGLHLYIALEFLLEIFSTLPRAYFGVEIEPTFNEPYLATCLQDFWGRRWNLIVTNILRLTVYDPMKSTSARLVGRKRATFLAVLAVFLVSVVMHELIFYYIGRKKPTGDLTRFFLVHGICLLTEIAAKKSVNGTFRLPVGVSRSLTLAFVVVTASWWFMPEVLRCEFDVKARQEIGVIVNFLKSVVQGLRSITFI